MMKRLQLGCQFVVVLVLACAAAWGQAYSVSTAAESQPQNAVEGVFLGFVTDPVGQQVHPIRGIPGASTMSQPLYLGVNLTRAAVSPRQDYLLAPAGRDLKPTQFRTSGGRLLAQPLNEVMLGAERITISPGGSAAVFYDAGQARIQVLTGLPDAPALKRDLDAAMISARKPFGSIAISDDGEALVASLAQGDEESVFLLAPEGAARFILSLRRVSAMTFLADSHDLLLADQWRKEVYRVHDVNGPAAITLLAAEQEGIEAPFAVAASRGGQRAFIANSRSGTIAIVDLVTGATHSISCPCVPAGLYPLKGDSVFRLTNPSEGPMWLLDGDAAQPRIVFVPPNRGPMDDSQSPSGRSSPRSRNRTSQLPQEADSR